LVRHQRQHRRTIRKKGLVDRRKCKLYASSQNVSHRACTSRRFTVHCRRCSDCRMSIVNERPNLHIKLSACMAVGGFRDVRETLHSCSRICDVEFPVQVERTLPNKGLNYSLPGGGDSLLLSLTRGTRRDGPCFLNHIFRLRNCGFRNEPA
jgi:hypothetical protein